MSWVTVVRAVVEQPLEPVTVSVYSPGVETARDADCPTTFPDESVQE